MSELYQSLSHSKWDCKYHVVFVPKRRRKAIFGGDPAAIGTDFPCAGTAEGMSDSGRAPHAGPCAYVYRHPTQASGGVGNRVSEREECYRGCSIARQGSKLLGGAFLGSGLCRFHGGIRVGASSPIHPRARERGWNRRTVLSCYQRRAWRDA